MPHIPFRKEGDQVFPSLTPKQQAKKERKKFPQFGAPQFLVRRGPSLQPGSNFNKKFLESAKKGAFTRLAPGLNTKQTKKAIEDNPTLEALSRGIDEEPIPPGKGEPSKERKRKKEEAKRRAALAASLGATPRGLELRGLTLLSQDLLLG